MISEYAHSCFDTFPYAIHSDLDALQSRDVGVLPGGAPLLISPSDNHWPFTQY